MRLERPVNTFDDSEHAKVDMICTIYTVHDTRRYTTLHATLFVT